MVAVLLAGGPGSGKSTVAAALQEQGRYAVDLDYGYARHEDSSGSPVSFPPAPDLAWLTAHHWQWIDGRLTELLAHCRSRNAVLCGTAFNMFDYLDRFGLVILLRCDDRTMDARLRDPKRANIFGKVGDTAVWSRWWRTRVEEELGKRQARIVDAHQPLPQVVSTVLDLCAAAGHPISGDTTV
ncbi:hypothetical protein GCM10009742_43230 [Kribbella karoonensis]|uniref:AAA domain-containing protein n=1 Tax=Kribbella karoonensis TaxID=324851 RepID=A0ABN2E1M4_9ACTN